MTRLLASTLHDGRVLVLTHLDCEAFVTAFERGGVLTDARVFPLGELKEAIHDWQDRKRAVSC